ncbi:MAG: hypothetical protein EXS09_10715 [Gemmataceae bacterium]|nr:hypothetical protein [Gemmataceae bacterium]
MTQQTRIGLLAFAGVGGIFIVIVVGVVIVAASQSKPSQPTEPAAIAKASPKSAATRQRVEPRPVVSPPSPSSVIKPIVEAAKSIARNPKEWDFKDLADHLK